MTGKELERFLRRRTLLKGALGGVCAHSAGALGLPLLFGQTAQALAATPGAQDRILVVLEPPTGPTGSSASRRSSPVGPGRWTRCSSTAQRPPAANATSVSFSNGTLAPNSVLVLYPDNQQRAANVLFDRSFRDHLGSLPGAPADCFSEFLDEEHFPTDYQDRMRDFLRAKYDERPPAVIVAFAAPSLEFCSRYCSLLFPRVPIVFAAMGAESTWARGLGPGVTGVRSSFDGARTLRLALQLHPRTRHVFIVADESDGPVDQEFESTLHASGLQARLQAVPPQPLPQFLNMLAQLPENSLVIDLAVLGRSNATTFPPAQRVEWMARTSRAPVCAACDPLVGDGLFNFINCT